MVEGRDRSLAIAIPDGSEYREGRIAPDRCVAVVIIVVVALRGVEMQANSVRSRPGLAVGCPSQRLVMTGEEVSRYV